MFDRLLLLLLLHHRVSSQGSPWTGDMHPHIPLGANPSCNLTTLQNCAPTYALLKQNNKSWPCPDGLPSPKSCGYGTCVPGTGSNPLCSGRLNETSPCCCPKKGCSTTRNYNTVIGVCRGDGCACGNSVAPSCQPQGNSEQCGGAVNGVACNGTVVRCCFGANVEELVEFYDLGTQALINYWAAYQFDDASKQWIIQEESSFNTDGSKPPCNLTAKYCGFDDPSDAWLSPQPGGSAFWSLGYYPAGVKGVGSVGNGGGRDGGEKTATMFILSTEQFWGGTWYMLNQLTLDRGPASSMPADECSVTNDNCWASGNAGEMDFMETGWNLRNISDDPHYQRSFSTQFNQIGRCFNGGVNGGGFTSPNWLATSPPILKGGLHTATEPIVYVAVVDKVGNWVYRLPADQAETIWPGVGRKSAEARIQAAPTTTPTEMNPCTGGYCAVFTSNCQATTVAAARAQQCGFNGDQGFCGQYTTHFANTGQPLYPNNSCVKDVRGGVEMPWCVEMVHGNAPPPSPSPGPGPGPGPSPTKGCPACTATQCASESCGKTVPYLCLGGAAVGGCTGNPTGWPSSGACTGCCNSFACLPTLSKNYNVYL